MKKNIHPLVSAFLLLKILLSSYDLLSLEDDKSIPPYSLDPAKDSRPNLRRQLSINYQSFRTLFRPPETNSLKSQPSVLHTVEGSAHHRSHSQPAIPCPTQHKKGSKSGFRTKVHKRSENRNAKVHPNPTEPKVFIPITQAKPKKRTFLSPLFKGCFDVMASRPKAEIKE